MTLPLCKSLKYTTCPRRSVFPVLSCEAWVSQGLIRVPSQIWSNKHVMFGRPKTLGSEHGKQVAKATLHVSFGANVHTASYLGDTGQVGNHQAPSGLVKLMRLSDLHYKTARAPCTSPW